MSSPVLPGIIHSSKLGLGLFSEYLKIVLQVGETQMHRINTRFGFTCIIIVIHFRGVSSPAHPHNRWLYSLHSTAYLGFIQSTQHTRTCSFSPLIERRIHIRCRLFSHRAKPLQSEMKRTVRTQVINVIPKEEIYDFGEQ